MNKIIKGVDRRILIAVIIVFVIIQSDLLRNLYQRIRINFTMESFVILLIVLIIFQQLNLKNMINFEFFENHMFHILIGLFIIIYIFNRTEGYENIDGEEIIEEDYVNMIPMGFVNSINWNDFNDDPVTEAGCQQGNSNCYSDAYWRYACIPDENDNYNYMERNHFDNFTGSFNQEELISFYEEITGDTDIQWDNLPDNFYETIGNNNLDQLKDLLRENYDLREDNIVITTRPTMCGELDPIYNPPEIEEEMSYWEIFLSWFS